MIRYQRHFVTRGEIWFDGASPSEAADVLEYYHVLKPVDACRSEDFYTIVFDLTEDIDAIFARVRPETRRQIRRVMHDADLSYESWFPATAKPLREFMSAYERLAAHKHLAALSEVLMQSYADAGVLDLSVVRRPDGTAISWHANFRTKDQMRVIHSVSAFRDGVAEDRNGVGRAHRWHMWQDMQRAKAAGIRVFDLGGWYNGSSDQELLRVNAFKESFGGTIVRRYICERGATWKGKLYLALRNAFGEGPLNAMSRVEPDRDLPTPLVPA